MKDKPDYTLTPDKSSNINTIIRHVTTLTEEETNKLVAFMKKENMI